MLHYFDCLCPSCRLLSEKQQLDSVKAYKLHHHLICIMHMVIVMATVGLNDRNNALRETNLYVEYI